jgi:L-ascorbate metabolism protein UlaG (beta-lactamase superfamily)
LLPRAADPRGRRRAAAPRTRRRLVPRFLAPRRLLPRFLLPRFFLLVSTALVLSACSRRPPPALFARDHVDVSCCGHSDQPIEVVFLGVAGWLLRMGETAILTAPLFSNPSLLRAGLAPIHADPERIERHLPDVSDVTAILVGHGHYDHLMDVPYVAQARAPRAVIYGTATMAHQLAPFGLARERVRVLRSDELGDVEETGSWIPVAPSARIMALRSDHAPHFAGVTLYSGVRTRDMEREPSSAREWLDGETVAFLIDLLNRDGSVALRVYFQDAIAAPPLGLVPPLPDGLGVDVALVVPATYAEVSWHPEALLNNASPRRVLLGHWENFFQPPEREAEPVPFTDLRDFIRRLERALPDGSSWHLPMPGTRFTFH